MKYVLHERRGKKGKIASQLFNDKLLLMLTAKRILLGKKVFDDSFPGAPMKEDSF